MTCTDRRPMPSLSMIVNLIYMSAITTVFVIVGMSVLKDLVPPPRLMRVISVVR